MIAHAKYFSASASARWLACPGSVIPSAQVEDGQTNIFAIEGTRAHEVADLCLKKGKDAEFYRGKKVLNEIVDDEMVIYVQEYLDYIRSHETDTSELMTEERVDYSNVVPDGFGTMDAAVIDGDTVHIFDLKYGRGVQVYAVNNTQAQFYCLGLLNELGWMDTIKHFRIHIVQPRKVTPEPWDITVEDLEKFAEYATKQAEIAMKPGAPRVPGEKQCQWCKLKHNCAALEEYTVKTIGADFDDLDALDAEELNDAQRRKILEGKKMIELFLTAVEDYTFAKLNDGEKIPGFKLVEGRTIRKWTDDAEAVLTEKLGEDAFGKKMLGIGAIEKLIGKEVVAEITYKPEGKPTLALESDRRKPLDIDVSSDFEELD
jgi:hypothetical protein